MLKGLVWAPGQRPSFKFLKALGVKILLKFESPRVLNFKSPGFLNSLKSLKSESPGFLIFKSLGVFNFC